VLVQLAHWAPETPHAVFWLPTAQTSVPTQHPSQLAGPQLGAGTQIPPLQASLTPHAMHTAPFRPQAPGLVARTQALPTQQPGQVAGPHVTGVWQVRSAPQTRLVALQFVQAWPSRPHAVASLPGTHVVPKQHPLQLPALQLGVPWQTPPPPGMLRQVCPEFRQLVHA